MVKEKRIIDESVKNINELFKHLFLLVGLREKNLPNDLETLFLHQFIRENYGGHSIEEVKMAFRMAIKSELDLEPDEINCYENFSVRYLSTIMNAYRKWASEKFSQIEKHIPPNESELKLLEAPEKVIHWGALIEHEYQHFLSFGDERWKLFPVDFYNQLVADDFFEKDIFRKAMPIVRKGMIGKHQKDLAVAQMREFPDNTEDERILKVQSMNKKTIQDCEIIIEEYMSGKKDSELEVIAKQYCVLQLFKNSKQNMKQNIYVQAKD